MKVLLAAVAVVVIVLSPALARAGGAKQTVLAKMKVEFDAWKAEMTKMLPGTTFSVEWGTMWGKDAKAQKSRSTSFRRLTLTFVGDALEALAGDKAIKKLKAVKFVPGSESELAFDKGKGVFTITIMEHGGKTTGAYIRFLEEHLGISDGESAPPADDSGPRR
jgi:hypothetical protein